MGTESGTAEKVYVRSIKNNIVTLVLLIIAGAMIYSLPYFRSYYYDTFVEIYGLTNTQMGALGSAYGGFAIIAYFLGGFCADRWPAKKLLFVSLVVTGVLGFLLLLKPPYWALFAIHAVWGITSILTFWNALVKALRSIASEKEQGRVFGLFEGGRGITNMVQSAAVLAAFGILSEKISAQAGLFTIIIIYSVIDIALGFLILFMYREPPFHRESNAIVNLPVLKRVLKMPTTWLNAIIIFCSYAICCSYFYITPYTTAVFGATAVIGAAIGYFSQYVRPVGCFIAGFTADRIGSSKVLLGSFILMIIGMLGLIFIPGKKSMIGILLVFCAVIYASMYAAQSMHFAIMEEADNPVEVTGTVTAILTPLGYSVELFAPLIAGRCLDRWEGAKGYQVFFGVLTILLVIGLFCTIAWLRLTKEKRENIQKARLQAKAEKKKKS